MRVWDVGRLGALERVEPSHGVVEDAPALETRRPAQLRVFLGHIDDGQRAGTSAEDLAHHRLVLHGVERARAVHHAAADLQQRRASHRDLHLQRVQPEGELRVPPRPQRRALAQCAVAAARHVAHDAVVDADAVVAALLLRRRLRSARARASASTSTGARWLAQGDVGELLCLVLCHHKARTRQPHGSAPPDKHVPARWVQVVGDHQPAVLAAVRGRRTRRRRSPWCRLATTTTTATATLEDVQDLGGLGPRRSTHV